MLLKSYCETFFSRIPHDAKNLLAFPGYNTDDSEMIKEDAFYSNKFSSRNVVTFDWINKDIPGFLFDYIYTKMTANSQVSRIGHWIYLNEERLNGCSVCCHSMGSHVFLNALKSIKGNSKISFEHVFIYAGDVRSDFFELNPKVRAMIKKLHVFYNRSDAALVGSTVMNLHARLGEHACKQATTNVDCHGFAHLWDSKGHGYFSDDNGGNESPVMKIIKGILI